MLVSHRDQPGALRPTAGGSGLAHRGNRSTVNARLPEHSNADWIAALRGESGKAGAMVLDLERYLFRALATTLRRRQLPDEELQELTQEAFSQLLAHLHTFRGDSALPTWAVAVATRVAFTELRRRDARAKNHADFERSAKDALERSSPGVSIAEASLDRRAVLDALHEAIESELSDKQKIATLSLLRGVPTIEIAERTGSNQNAVYKLVHDARLRLREALERRGVTADLLHELSAEAEA